MELGGNGLKVSSAPGLKPDGVSFKKFTPLQYTAYAVGGGDEGSRVQSDWYNFPEPIFPKVYAELDYSVGPMFNVLKSPLVVNGVSSTNRFVDINGLQAFSATGNADKAVIDKLYGGMYTRASQGSKLWAAHITDALNFSLVLNSVTYNDWFLLSRTELETILHLYQNISASVDTNTSAILFNTLANIYTATTLPTQIINAFYYAGTDRTIVPLAKASFSVDGIYITKAHHLITAP